MLRDHGTQNLILGLRSQMPGAWMCDFAAENPGLKVTGHVPLIMEGTACRRTAACSIHIPKDWVQHMPFVFTSEPWLKRKPDWHVNPGGTLCYALINAWRDVLGQQVVTNGAGAAGGVAADWIINSLGVLLGRHYFAHTTSMTRWPDSWDAWAHGQDGVNEYLSKNE